MCSHRVRTCVLTVFSVCYHTVFSRVVSQCSRMVLCVVSPVFSQSSCVCSRGVLTVSTPGDHRVINHRRSLAVFTMLSPALSPCSHRVITVVAPCPHSVITRGPGVSRVSTMVAPCTNCVRTVVAVVVSAYYQCGSTVFSRVCTAFPVGFSSCSTCVLTVFAFVLSPWNHTVHHIGYGMGSQRGPTCGIVVAPQCVHYVFYGVCSVFSLCSHCVLTVFSPCSHACSHACSQRGLAVFPQSG